MTCAPADIHTAAQGCSLDEVVAAVVASGGPQDNGTKAEPVKWHDDKVPVCASSQHACIQ